jgi:enoyl-CoA hydratase/carnithine racemase
VTLDDLPRRNALATADWLTLTDALSAWAGDDEVGAVVVTGAGNTFCAGARLDELDAASQDPESAAAFVHAIVDGLRAVRYSAKPVVGAINGPAIGGGAELALACDVRIGTRASRLHFPMLRLGVVIDRVTLRALLHALPLGRVQNALLLGSALEADEAHRAGLLAELVDPGTILTRALAVAEELAELDAGAVKATRAAINDIVFPATEDPAAEMLASIRVRGATRC